MEGTPAAELLPGTGQIWLDALCKFSPDRLAKAFDSVEASATRWPTPAVIAEHMPSVAAMHRLYVPQRRQLSEDPVMAAVRKARIDKVIQECADKLGVKL